MLHLLFWLVGSLLHLIFSLFLCAWMILLACAFISLLDLKKSNFFLFFFPLVSLLIFLLSPVWLNFLLSTFCSAALILLPPSSDPLKVNAMIMFIKSTKILIKIRETAFISDKNYFRLKTLKLYIFFFLLFFLTLLFASFYQLTIFTLVLSCSLTAMLLGLSMSFFSSLLSFPFSRSSSLTPSNLNLSGPPSLQFSSFLKNKMDSHPLNAMIEENFYEDNLQMGDFFMSYPLFFKASSLNSPFSSPEEEIINLWHVIRWESAFSKQTGSATSRWSSIYGINSSMPASAHSVHTPLIPVFSAEIFEHMKNNNLPVFDPFNQPPEWSPYLLVMNFLNWTEEEMKEERLSEMEEED